MFVDVQFGATEIVAVHDGNLTVLLAKLRIFVGRDTVDLVGGNTGVLIGCL